MPSYLYHLQELEDKVIFFRSQDPKILSISTQRKLFIFQFTTPCFQKVESLNALIMVFGNQTKLNPSISSASHSTLRHQETCKRTSVSQSVKYQHTRVSVNACTATQCRASNVRNLHKYYSLLLLSHCTCFCKTLCLSVTVLLHSKATT